MKGRAWIASGAVLVAAAVAAGAIGTHVLKETVKLESSALETYDIAVRYQMIHALGLILVGLLASHTSSRLVSAAGAAFASESSPS